MKRCWLSLKSFEITKRSICATNYTLLLYGSAFFIAQHSVPEAFLKITCIVIAIAAMLVILGLKSSIKEQQYMAEYIYENIVIIHGIIDHGVKELREQNKFYQRLEL